jgi:calcineurin-like phosphoesterase family protein
MSNVRFISDPHFGHKWMASHRGFHDEFYHDEHIISCWNKVVNKRDLTYILGDITMESSKHYYRLDSLNGRKYVILGNHDMRGDISELLKYVDGVAGMVKYKQGIILTHCPIHPCEMDRFTHNIHGHVHENTLADQRYINVSAEVVDYTPKLLKELIQ